MTYKKTIFTVISSDDSTINESIKWYNDTYGCDFKVEEFIYDEVVFARLSVTRFTLTDIFNLGYQFGANAQIKRNKGEIDW